MAIHRQPISFVPLLSEPNGYRSTSSRCRQTKKQANGLRFTRAAQIHREVVLADSDVQTPALVTVSTQALKFLKELVLFGR
jgi:hypothetical protein